MEQPVAVPGDFDVEGAFLRVVQSMQLSSLETAALRLSIARSDDVIKEALEAFRASRDEEQLKDSLRAIARKTIEDTLDEANYSIGSPDGPTADDRLMGTAAAREHVFPMLLSELVKENLMEPSSQTVLLDMFKNKRPEITAALDSYDTKNDMAELVTTLQVLG